MLEKQDSNQVGLYVVREVNGAIPANPVFATREPNTYSKFGGDYKSVARNPFNPSRQNKKGTISDLDTSGEWNEDVTLRNMYDIFEGFFFAAIRRKAFQAVTAIDVADDQFTVADGTHFVAGDLLLSSNFVMSGNNGLKHVTGSGATEVTISEPLSAEVPGATAMIMRVGHRFAAGDASLVLSGNMVALAFAAFDPATLGLIPGEWAFLGGDTALSQFEGVKPGYARVNHVDSAAKRVYFDKTTFVAANDDGDGQAIELYMGFFVKNEDDPDLIVKSTFTLERPLGKDDDGTQSDNLQKYVFNSLKWNSPLSNKVTVDITGVGLKYGKRTGAQGLLAKQPGATITKALGEDAINTSVNVYRMRLASVDPDTLNPTPYFARATEWNATINNNVTAAKSQGTLGGFDTTVGQFAVSLSVTAYYSTIAAIQAIEDNDDTTFDAIYTMKNAALIWDFPLVSLGGGELTIAQNQPIMMPLTNTAAESPFGHTVLFEWMPYVPNVGMSSGA